MEYSNIITFLLVLMLILFVFVVMVNFIIPFKLKSDFDDISSSYHSLIQLEGGMSNSVRKELENELEKIGISDIDIRCKSIDEVRYGEKFEFYVSGTFSSRIPNHYLVFENREKTLSFRRVSFSKKLVN